MLGENLKKLRGKRTQEETAKKIGISRARYSHYENGIREPDYETLQSIADYYEVSVGYLLGNTDEPHPQTLADKDEAEFLAFANDPTLGKWYKELPQNREEDLQKLRKVWEILKDNGEI